MSIRLGAASPEAIRLTIDRPTGSTVDLTTVESCSVVATKPDGSRSTWAFSIVSSTASQLVVRREFSADGNDLPQSVGAGTLKLDARLRFPGAVTRRCRVGSVPITRE